FDPIATREVSRSTTELPSYVGNILGLRLVFALMAFGLTLIYVLASHSSDTVNRLLVILSLSYVVNALTPRWSFLALEHTFPLALAGFISQGCFLGAAMPSHRRRWSGRQLRKSLASSRRRSSCCMCSPDCAGNLPCGS